MKRNVLHWLAAIIFVIGTGGATLAIATPQPTYACTDHLLTFPAWYKGLQATDCSIVSPADPQAGGIQSFIWKIVLNVIDILLQLVGYLSVGFIIFGGFKYMTSAGSPDGMVKARKTITNAVVGLVISIFSVVIVNAIAGAIH
ncbi:MAG: pilin [Candidatus Saccharimonadales bacterium]